MNLLETVVAITLSCILLLSATISFHALFSDNQLQNDVEQCVAALLFARSEAITLQTRVSVLPNQSDWQSGMRMINQNSHTLIRVFSFASNQYQIDFRGTLGKSSELVWRSDGMTAGQQGSFFFCNKQDSQKKSAQIILLRTGRLRVVIGNIGGCH